MSNFNSLVSQWKQTSEKIAAIGAMRPGTVSGQRVKYRNKDGALKENGPYPVLTFKKDNKTKMIRLQSDEEIEVVEKQIKNFRNFKRLTKELTRIGKEMADSELGEVQGGKKNSSKISKQNKKGKRRPSSSN